jgi:hypothetical protein
MTAADVKFQGSLKFVFRSGCLTERREVKEYAPGSVQLIEPRNFRLIRSMC